VLHREIEYIVRRNRLSGGMRLTRKRFGGGVKGGRLRDVAGGGRWAGRRLAFESSDREPNTGICSVCFALRVVLQDTHPIVNGGVLSEGSINAEVP